MSSIDELIAKSTPKADFSGFTDAPKAYFDAAEMRSKKDLRDAFKGGIPTLEDGSPDFAAMARTLYQKGGLSEGTAAAQIGLQRDQLRYGQQAGESDFPSGAQLPPSPNRSGSVPVAPAIKPAGGSSAGAPSGFNPKSSESISGVVQSSLPAELAGPLIAQASARLKIDPDVPLRPEQKQQLSTWLQAYQRGQPGAPQQPGVQPAPQVAQAPAPSPQAAQPPPATAAPPAQPSLAQTDPTLGGLVPAGRTPQQQLDMLSRRVASGLLSPQQTKVYETRIKAIQDAISLTPDQKNAAASGQSLTDYQNRGDENTTQRDILTKSILPRLDKSQEGANAARDDITSIHRAREQLDQPGGIFNGSAADVRLKLAKVADFLGIENSSKIANTETFGTALAARVLPLVKGLGAGSGISNADREFARDMAGGNIKLDEKSIRRILDIGEAAARVKIAQHKKQLGNIVDTTESLKSYRKVYDVDEPGAYQKPQASQSAFTKGQTAFNPQTKQRIMFDGSQWVPAQ